MSQCLKKILADNFLNFLKRQSLGRSAVTVTVSQTAVPVCQWHWQAASGVTDKAACDSRLASSLSAGIAGECADGFHPEQFNYKFAPFI